MRNIEHAEHVCIDFAVGCFAEFSQNEWQWEFSDEITTALRAGEVVHFFSRAVELKSNMVLINSSLNVVETDHKHKRNPFRLHNSWK